MSDKKTHWRKHEKSDHLGSVDLDEIGGQVTATIVKIEYKQETVAGKKGWYRIATFKENLKPLVLNVVNSKAIQRLVKSKYIEDWNREIEVVLYVKENIKFGHDLVDGVRIRSAKLVEKNAKPKPKKDINAEGYASAIQAVKRKQFTADQIIAQYNLTDEEIKELKSC